MKLRRRIFCVFCIALIVFGSITTFAASYGTFYHPNANAAVSASVSFVEGPLLITDKVWWNATIYGSDVQESSDIYAVTYAKIAVYAGKGEKTKWYANGSETAKWVQIGGINGLRQKCPLVYSGSEVSCKTGNTWAKMDILMDGVMHTITATDN